MYLVDHLIPQLLSIDILRRNRYKPRTQPGNCESCSQRKVRHAYHRVCLDCASKTDVCAMCKQPGSVIKMPKSRAEEAAEEEAQALKLSRMRERERRTFIRKQENEAAAAAAHDEFSGDESEGDASEMRRADGSLMDPTDSEVLALSRLDLDQTDSEKALAVPGEPADDASVDELNWEAELDSEDGDD